MQPMLRPDSGLLIRKLSCKKSWIRQQVFLLTLLLLLAASSVIAQQQAYYDTTPVIGGQKAAFETKPFVDATYENATSFRQDLCPRYESVRQGKLKLADALRGLELRPLFAKDLSLEYSDEFGIDTEYPGLPAALMDIIAERAGFTWRQSFAIHTMAPYYDMTWTQLLWWGVNTYDIAVLNWDQSMERMELGIVFVEPFYDGSIILIDKPKMSHDKQWESDMIWNWTRPFDTSVWLLIAATILISGLVHQVIEYMHNEQQDRPWGQWFMDNLYLSTLNFTQNFEYAPSSPGGRIFAVSMAVWSLVIIATYTANLASLFVEEHEIKFAVSTIEEAAAQRIPICTLLDSNSDTLIKTRYQSAIRRPKVTELELYQALRAGECQLAADSRNSWDRFRGQYAYNPDCSLAAIENTVVAEIKSGFAVKGDVGHKCSGLIQQVFNLYFLEIIAEGLLDEAWLAHRTRQQDWDCDANPPRSIGYYNDPTSSNNDNNERIRQRRHLQQASSPSSTVDNNNNNYHYREKQQEHHSNRKLKGGGGRSGGSSRGAQGEPTTSSSSHSLTIQQMMGTFVLHYGLMVLALVATFVSPYWSKLTKSWGWPQAEPLVIRSHGPTVGGAPSGFRDSVTGSVIQAYGPPMARARAYRQSTSSLPSLGPMNMEGGSRSAGGHVRINTRVIPRKQTTIIRESNNTYNGGSVFSDETAVDDDSNDRIEQSKSDFVPPQVDNNKRQAVVDRLEDDRCPAEYARLREHFDTELKKTTHQFEERIGSLVLMLTEMRSQDEQFRKEVVSALTRSPPPSPSSRYDLPGQDIYVCERRNNFGHYLMQSQQQQGFQEDNHY